MATLIMRLAGAMQSWGTQGRFSVRETGLEPSKSGVIGLVCCALGKPRRELAEHSSRWPELDQLAALRMGVRVDRPGILLYDYQTAGGAHRKNDDYGVPKSDGSAKRTTVVSKRYYLSDSEFIIGLEGDEALLGRIEKALKAPVWPLYLGRKSYVPDGPIQTELTTRGLKDALGSWPRVVRTPLEKEKAPPRLRLVFDADGGQDGELRIDIPISFFPRKFAARRVSTEWIEKPLVRFEEEGVCI